MSISVIIVSWNVRDELQRCLTSLQASSLAPLDTIVVDNDSHDETAEMVASVFPRVTFIKNATNKGFGAAANRGGRLAKGDILFFLNPDTTLERETLQHLAERFEHLPKAGVVGTKILNPDGSPQHSVRAFPSVASQALILLKIHNFFPRLLPIAQYYRWDFDYMREQSVDQVMGASFAVRRSVFEKLGGFDEAFWIWFEEVDFCKRVRDAGWDVVYSPAARIVHEKGKSFARVHPVRREWWFIRSMHHYFWKHYRIASLFLPLVYPFALLLALGTRLARMVLRKNPEL